MSPRIFTPHILRDLISVAAETSRKRQHLNIHQNFEDSCQRLLNAVGIDSYIRPHRHSLDPKSETLFAVKGKFALVVFNEQGSPQQVNVFGTELFGELAAGVELAPGTWHTVVALSDNAVLLEIKAGPFNPQAAKEFAPWAPEEGAAQAAHYLRNLRRLIAEYEPAV